MRGSPVRLSQLTRLLPSASKKALRATLRDLERAQIVVRSDMSDTVLHVEYDFADDMRVAICALLDDLANWGDSLESRGSRRPDSLSLRRTPSAISSIQRITAPSVWREPGCMSTSLWGLSLL